MAIVLLAAACGSGGGDPDDEATTGDPESVADDSVASTTSVSTTTTTTSTTTTTTTTSTTSTTTSLPVETAGPLDCTATEAILALLWNDWTAGLADEPVFAAFGSDDPPTGTMSITAFDPDAGMLAGVWLFPDPQGDGLASGVVWRDGVVVGDVYYLDGVEPITSGEVDLLDGGSSEITIELATDQNGEAVVDDCIEKVLLASPISYETPLTIHGIGVIRPGMTLTEVVQATGHAASFPFDDVEFEFSDGTCFHAALDGTDVTLQMSGLGPDSSRFEATVGAVIVDTPTYRTPSGMMIGTPQADVEAALGDQLEISPHKYEEGWYLDFVPVDTAEQHLRLRFVITGGTVTEMRAGLAEWTSLVEGCA